MEQFWPKQCDKAQYQLLKRKSPLQEATFNAEEYTTNGKSLPQLFCWQLLTKLSIATLSTDAVCNLCYSLIALGGNDKRMLVQRAVPRISAPVFSSGKKQSAGQIVSVLATPVCYLQILHWRERESWEFTNKRSGEGQRESLLISSVSNTTWKPTSVGGPSNSPRNFNQNILI